MPDARALARQAAERHSAGQATARIARLRDSDGSPTFTDITPDHPATAVHPLPPEHRRMSKTDWTPVQCDVCSGGGVVDVGYMEVVPGECKSCAGNGVQWVHNRTGTIALYPGGPLRGRVTAKVPA